MLVPLRHLRPHIGFATMFVFRAVYQVDEMAKLTDMVSELLSAVEDAIAHRHFQIGLIYDSETHAFVQQPRDLDSNPPRLWHLLRDVSSVLKISRFDGAQYGTRCKRTEVVPSAVTGRLLIWHRDFRESYVVVNIQPFKSHLMDHYVSWNDSSYVLFYAFHNYYDDDVPLETAISTDNLDFPPLSPIPWQPSSWRSYIDEDEVPWIPPTTTSPFSPWSQAPAQPAPAPAPAPRTPQQQPVPDSTIMSTPQYSPTSPATPHTHISNSHSPIPQ